MCHKSRTPHKPEDGNLPAKIETCHTKLRFPPKHHFDTHHAQHYAPQHTARRLHVDRSMKEGQVSGCTYPVCVCHCTKNPRMHFFMVCKKHIFIIFLPNVTKHTPTGGKTNAYIHLKVLYVINHH